MNEPKLRSGYSSSDQSALQSLSDLNQHVQNKIKLTIKEDKNNNLLRQSNGVPSSSIQQQQQQQDEFPREQLHQIRETNQENEDEYEGGEGEDSQQNEGSQEFNNKRIILQRFTIYNSTSTMYIVGSNSKESLFRIMEISKDEINPNELSIIEDRNYFYTRKDMIALLNGLDESIEGGIHKIAQGYGMLGLIRFTQGYYLCLITKCSQVAILGGHFIYHIDETKLIPLGSNYKRQKREVMKKDCYRSLSTWTLVKHFISVIVMILPTLCRQISFEIKESNRFPIWD